ncbi:DUF2608 domain-containing protein [Colwellia sp. RSH04]|uniref:DUF2608 domain-containing protein n=1 Tax=Colwellia sp. RSH04 TaxID=2305464 RepID=UPI000E5849E4|nr:DUF2608 domain-containing protein [Colwellia sp. RSH04]RHW77854.1 DUF2608 domain-containing protein [Colwellia sp. RSH04]
MKSNKILALVAAMTLLPSYSAMAASTQGKTDSFEAIKHQVNKWAVPKATLVVMDNDDTISMMSCPDSASTTTCQYLGGAAWFAWQSEQVNSQKSPRVSENFSDLLDISSFLFSISNMVFTRDNVAPVLKELTGNGVRLLVETARGNGDVNATEDQFTNLLVAKETSLKTLIKENSLVLNKNGIASKASPYIPCSNSDMNPITYQNGVMYLAGQDKGSNLRCMLDSYNAQQGKASRVTNIVFIDDTLKNVQSVHNEFLNNKNYTVLSLHYTALAEHKLAFTQGRKAKEYQRVSMERWYKIKSAMELALLEPAIPN